jgi:hypothetical protein
MEWVAHFGRDDHVFSDKYKIVAPNGSDGTKNHGDIFFEKFDL